MNTFLDKIKKHWAIIVLFFLASCFFVFVSMFISGMRMEEGYQWLSPDESANYFFSKNYAEKGELSVFKEVNVYGGDIIHPRSMRSDLGFLVPISFLGIILIFGKLASFLGVAVIPYLTPFFASFCIIFFYFLIKKIFDKNVAIISSFILAVFPPFLYYSARSMFHNVLFISFFIVGLYFFIIFEKKREWLSYLLISLSGSFFGLAIITRTSEILWLLPLLLFLLIFNFKKLGYFKILIFIAFLFLTLMPAMYWNNALFGSFLQNGYTASSGLSAVTALNNISVDDGVINTASTSLFFGFEPYHSLKMVYYYFARMFYWIFIPAMLGIIFFIVNFKKYNNNLFFYFLAYFFISLIIIFYYGSWEIHDNPDPDSFTIGNSYTRYWLPVYLGAIPFASMFFLKAANLIKNSFYRVVIIFLFIILIIFTSINFVLSGSEEGLIYPLAKKNEAMLELKEVVNMTEDNAIIITQYHDKLFFGKRDVIVGRFDQNDLLKKYYNLVEFYPVYYYNFTLPDKDMEYLNNKRLLEFGLSIKVVKKISQDFTLYRLGFSQN